jgi:hypothetical protein
MPRRARRAPRRPRRRARKARLYKSMRGGALKSYTYNFKLLPQFLTNTGLGSVDIVTAAGGTGLNPIRQLSATPPGVSNVTSTSPLFGPGGPYLDVGLAASHCLSDLSNFSTFASMYDAYKINYVKVELEFLSNIAAVNGVGIMPTIWLYWDQDDAVVPTLVTNPSGNMGARCLHPTASKTRFSMKYRPMIRDTVQGSLSGTTNNAAVRKSTWINCTQTDVPHYAFKAFITDYFAPATTTAHSSFRINFTYNITFRTPLLTT